MPKKKKVVWPDNFAHVDDIRSEIGGMVERLCELHDLTDPRKGQLSEKDKHDHAQRAVAIWWYIYSRLMLWVQSHFVGYEMARINPKLQNALARVRQGDLNENAHVLELIGSTYAINSAYHRTSTEEADAELEKMDLDLTDEALRRVIVRLLLSTSADSSVWRFPLSHALRALNSGEQVEFVLPAKTRRRGHPFALDQARAEAISHVHYLIGKGLKKNVALSRVANKIAVSPETLRDWEKQLREDDWHPFCWESARIAGQIEEDPDLASADVFDVRYYGITDSIKFAKFFLEGRLEGRNLEEVKKKLRELHKKNQGPKGPD
jgi:hypothetical protein